MNQFRYAALIAALFVLPAPSFAAEDVDADAAAQSGVHKEAGKDVDARVHGDANVDADMRVDGKTPAEIDAQGDAKAGAQVDDKPQHQNQSQ